MKLIEKVIEAYEFETGEIDIIKWRKKNEM